MHAGILLKNLKYEKIKFIKIDTLFDLSSACKHLGKSLI